jgi:hypothetical protein
MNLFSYTITRDYGFAPNPFPPYCTLATCKPRIRNSAAIGDWIMGISSAANACAIKKRLIYAMQVQEILTFDQYWNDLRFAYKKPIMNGSKRQTYGDNIYHTDESTNNFIQENSHHSLAGGVVNMYNYRRDLLSEKALISMKYWYWGKDAVEIPKKYIKFIQVGIGHKKIQDESLIVEVVSWLESNKGVGYIGEPCEFHGDFERYNGK